MKFVAFERKTEGTGASRRLRNVGKTPGIVYGGEGQPQLLDVALLDGVAVVGGVEEVGHPGRGVAPRNGRA